MSKLYAARYKANFREGESFFIKISGLIITRFVSLKCSNPGVLHFLSVYGGIVWLHTAKTCRFFAVVLSVSFVTDVMTCHVLSSAH